LLVAHGGSGSFTIVANSGYKLDGATVSCTGGSYNQAGSLTVTNVTSARTCTITLAQAKTTFTMSNTCSTPDTANNNSSPCYILAQENPGYGTTSVWDKKATYNGKTYKNCIINSYSAVRCDTNSSINIKYHLRFSCRTNDDGDCYTEQRWLHSSSQVQALCTVNLTCEQ